MKKLKQLFVALALFSAAALFMASCGGGNSDPGPVGTPDETYTINIASNIDVQKGTTAQLNYTLVPKDGVSPTSGITVTFTDATPNTGVTIADATSSPATITAADSAAVRAHNFTATAKKGGVTVATKTFTVTVKAGVVYTLTVEPVMVLVGASEEIRWALIASDQSATDALTVTFTSSDAPATLTIAKDGSGKDKITAAAGTAKGTYHYTATAKKGAETVTEAEFTVTVTTLDDVVIARAVVADMNIYRIGGTPNSYDITDFHLYQADNTEITNSEFINQLVPAITNNGGLTWNNARIVPDKSYEVKDYNVTISVTQPNGPDVSTTFKVTVSKLMLDVKFYNGASELSAASVEYSDKVTKPDDPVVEGFDFGGWYTTAALETAFDFDTPITAATNIYAKMTAAATSRDVVITVTLDSDPKAALQENEFIWINGNFQTSGTNWADKCLEKQADGTWKTTLNLPNATTSITYKLYAVKSNTSPGYGVSATLANQTGTIVNNEINITVTEWLNRPLPPAAGELLTNPGMEPVGGNWNYSNLLWTINGLGAQNTSGWLCGDYQFYAGESCFLDAQRSGGSWATVGTEVSITQIVADAASKGLADGIKVTLSVRIRSTTTEGAYSKFELICGGLSHPLTLPMPITPDVAVNASNNVKDNYTQYTYTFTLRSEDIVSDGLTVGLKYTPSAAVRTFIDDFSLVAVQ